jgi:hypothetical protein
MKNVQRKVLSQKELIIKMVEIIWLLNVVQQKHFTSHTHDFLVRISEIHQQQIK